MPKGWLLTVDVLVLRRLMSWPCNRVQAFRASGAARQDQDEPVFEIPRRLKYENKRRRSYGDSPISQKVTCVCSQP